MRRVGSLTAPPTTSANGNCTWLPPSDLNVNADVGHHQLAIFWMLHRPVLQLERSLQLRSVTKDTLHIPSPSRRNFARVGSIRTTTSIGTKVVYQTVDSGHCNTTWESCMASDEDLTFPFLAADSFDCACKAFVRRVDAAGGAQTLGWLAVEYSASEVGVKQKAN